MKKEDFDSMVAFTEPLYIEGNGPYYGFAFTLRHRDKNEIAHNIESYIQYLTCLVRWFEDGGSIDDYDLNKWYDTNGTAYRYDVDKYMIDYENKVYQEKPIRYNIIFGNTKFKKEDLDENFIIRI